jgi:hypothetical protein
MFKPGMKIPAKAVLSVQQSEPMFWEVIPPPKYPRKITRATTEEATADRPHVSDGPSKVRRQTRPCKSVSNQNSIYLADCWSFAARNDYLPHRFANEVDDIITGIARLDLGGNSRPIHKGLLFDMLRDLDEINVHTIREYAGFSERHSRRLAGLLRIAVIELNRIVDGGR